VTDCWTCKADSEQRARAKRRLERMAAVFNQQHTHYLRWTAAGLSPRVWHWTQVFWNVWHVKQARMSSMAKVACAPALKMGKGT
jgi:hypothetical protein